MKEYMQAGLRYAVVLSVLALIGFLGFGSLPQKAQEANKKGALFQKFAATDALTGMIRNKSSKFFRVKINNPAERSAALKLGQIVEDYGSFVVLAADKKSKPAASKLENQPLETSINLPSGKFEALDVPLLKAADVENGKNYYIVQFGAIAMDEWLESLRDAGAEVLQYVPHQAFFVYADGETISKITAHSRVRWVGKYNQEQKISPELTSFMSKAKGERAMFDVAVFARADLTEVSNNISNSIRGEILNVMKLPNNFFNVVRVSVPVSDVAEIAKINDVVRIDQFENPQIEDERAAQIVAGNYTSPTVISPAGYNPLSQFGVDGTGVTVAVSDDGVAIPTSGGFYITPANTVNGPLRGATAGASGGHGHINASIIAGTTPFAPLLDPTGYNYGVGIAPKANIINIPFLKAGNTFTDLQAVDDTLNTLGVNGIKGSISNNSWGNGTNSNSYDSYAGMYDGFVQDASIAATFDPITLVFSAGNCGNAPASTACNSQNGLTRPKVAKNVIAVANSENLRPELSASANNMEDLASSSSRGLAADGRIKPDITAPGTVISGSRAGNCSTVSSCFDTNHAWSSGTSHAAPQVAGAAALFTNFWKNNNAGVNPSPALIKAAIINTAQEMNGNLTNASTIPNGNEGWGRISMKNMLNTNVPMKYVNETQTFSSVGDSVIYSGVVGNAAKPVRFSLVWTDPPGVGNPALVNNLDLTVTIGANTYKGNVFSAGNSATGGNPDTLNNVENIFLPAGIPAGTLVTINISATAVNGNGVLGNPDATDQHFALVAYNFSELIIDNFNAPFDFDGDGKTDISIYRPSNGEWWYQKSSNGGNAAFQFGSSSDKTVPADFTGDGKDDIAVWRASTGEWFILRSENNSYYSFPFGLNGDKPLVGDFDGDGKADATIFRPSNSTWYVFRSTGGTTTETFGTGGDLPVVADYDGDGLSDIAIYRPGNGQWWISRSNSGVIAIQFGSAGDKPVQGDYTGDGTVDVAFYRPGSGEWFILRSEDFSYFSVPFGTNGDIPTPGDYDGDGKFDFAVFRPTQANWYLQRTTSGNLVFPFGVTTDYPVPNAFVP